MYNGPNITNTGLVYGYDTGIGTSTNDVATRLYPGRPTTNAIPGANTFGGGWVSYGNGNDGTFITEFGTTGYQMINRVSWNGIYQNFNLGSAGNYTFSAWFKYLGGTASNNGATVYVNNYGGPDTAVEINKGLVGVWQRISITVNVTSPSNVYFFIISYGGSGSDRSTWQVTMPQIESGTIRTPFVNGTRSATQALIDAKRATTIDLSTVSFNSSAQPIFDGTDDRINTGIRNVGNNITYEAVINSSGNATYYNMFFGQLLPYIGVLEGNRIIFSDSIGGAQQTIEGGTIPMGTNRHVVCTRSFNGSSCTNRIYVNGTQVAQGTFSGAYTGDAIYGNTIHIGDGAGFTWYPFWGSIHVARIYNRALTQTEIDQNFLGYRRRFNI